MSTAPGTRPPAQVRPRLCDVVRVPAPPRLTHPEVALWRPATLADVDAITATQKAMDAVDHPDWTTPREDVEDELELPVDLAVDSLLATDEDGRVLAWGVVQVRPANAEQVQTMLVGGVHPEVRGRGIGRIVLGWQLARGAARLALSEERLDGWMRLDADERNPGALALARRLGMRPVRWFTSMDRVVLTAAQAPAPPLPAPQLPPGTRVVRYTSERAEEARLARNDAFRDHWGSTETSPQRWEQFVGGPLFRADLSFLVVDEDDAVLGFALVSSNEEDWELQGYTSAYLGILGVVRAARGRGLAPALLASVLRATAAAGLERVVLDVDTENPTGALGLYERLGFVASSRSVTLVLDAPREDTSH